MNDGNAVSRRPLGAMELLSIGGFACFFGWMLISFYWLFAEYIQDASVAERDIVQAFVFAGLVLGYLALHFAGKNMHFNPFQFKWLATTAVLALSLPLAAILLDFGVVIPSSILCIINLCAGVGGALLTVGWLDACSRIRLKSLRRFTSLSLVGGGFLFALVTVVPNRIQPVFCVIYALLSVGLLHFASERGGSAIDTAPIDSRSSTWEFAWEIEPSLIAFGIVFGLTFVYLFNSGATAVLIGLLFVIPGAGVIALCAFIRKNVSITLIQRVLLCVTVLSCLAMPFTSDVIQIACSCLVIASWGAFVSVNYALVVKKSVENGGVPVFRQIPARLIFSAIGFFIGWGIAAVMTTIYGAHSDAFMIVRLCMAFILVVVIMLFFPSPEHHDHAPAATEQDKNVPSIISSNLSDKELFKCRCKAVAELYQLSPRETDILEFLAKGRNAAYIQNKLTISPHTVKSHIYSIYRKLDIHSQQKLMDFVEDYPTETQ